VGKQSCAKRIGEEGQETQTQNKGIWAYFEKGKHGGGKKEKEGTLILYRIRCMPNAGKQVWILI